MAKQYQERAYETPQFKLYRFSERHLSGFPKDLQVWENGDFVDCQNINIKIRIQKEKICKKFHHWSRMFQNSMFCKDCGVVVYQGEQEENQSFKEVKEW